MPSTATRSMTREHRDVDTGAYTVGVAVVRPRARPDPGSIPDARASAAPTVAVSAGPAAGGWLRRTPSRLLGGAGRMLGIDVARGLAVLALLYTVAQGGSVLSGWLSLVATALFVMVSGATASLMIEPAAASLSAGGNAAAVRVALRAAVLFVLGAVGAAVGGGGSAVGAVGLAGGGYPGIAEPAVLLQLLGALTALSLLVWRWRSRSLFAVAGLTALVLPVAHSLIVLWAANADTASAGPGISALRELSGLGTSGAFPPLVWCAPFVAGLAIGRLRADRAWRPFTLLACGGALFALALAASLLVGRRVPVGSRASVVLGPGLGSAFAGAPPSSTVGPVGLLAVSSLALTILALCLLVSRPLRWVLVPLSSLGSLALTASTVLFLAILLAPSAVLEAQTALVMWAASVAPAAADAVAAGVGLIAVAMAATLWRAVLGGGPMERLVAAVAARGTRREGEHDPVVGASVAGAAHPLRRSSFAPAGAAEPPGSSDVPGARASATWPGDIGERGGDPVAGTIAPWSGVGRAREDVQMAGATAPRSADRSGRGAVTPSPSHDDRRGGAAESGDFGGPGDVPTASGISTRPTGSRGRGVSTSPPPYGDTRGEAEAAGTTARPRFTLRETPVTATVGHGSATAPGAAATGLTAVSAVSAAADSAGTSRSTRKVGRRGDDGPPASAEGRRPKRRRPGRPTPADSAGRSGRAEAARLDAHRSRVDEPEPQSSRQDAPHRPAPTAVEASPGPAVARWSPGQSLGRLPY